MKSKVTINFHYKDLSSHPAWLDLLERKQKIIEGQIYQVINDEMEDEKREEIRLEVKFGKRFIESMKLIINNMSVKEQE